MNNDSTVETGIAGLNCRATILDTTRGFSQH